ncbi:haloacid dehalogenase-like hydrolase domain-containing 5 [Mercenaria mercenaria]|uniref:haloacid dehalogenase-like hydrolase domain-containing 5 n=1 Tax=Mercenaria mercenaria TaxID=6596 RepID=UPI001E1E033F|nr:haloacid dehalogenase-like hydrolase domain-containing 5 [Mercenaria mercenaria]
MATIASNSVRISRTFSARVGNILNNRNGRLIHHTKRYLKTQDGKRVDFGFLFDIDGVIVRGKKLLPSAKDAFRMLIDENGKFKVPVIFVTNAGNTLRQKKAKALSDWLDIEVVAEQVVMSHSPLKMFKQFHDKHILVSGQGPVVEIAKGLGFSQITTMDTLRQCFPHLDMVDHNRRKPAPCAFEQFFPRIEAVILFGEPVRWETNLQLVIDTLLSDGKPYVAPKEIPYPHMPVLACNMDLLWMAEACMPRFGHGCFLHSLESLYQKISGRELKYTALVGKPSELTYRHADFLLYEQARNMGMNGIKTIYCIGDNPESDIYGANLYDKYLQKRVIHTNVNVIKRTQQQTAGSQIIDVDETDTDSDLDSERTSALKDNSAEVYAKSCQSILVCTGVYCSSRDYVTYGRARSSNHNHRDFVLDPVLTQPKFVTQNVHEAVKLVFQKEKVISPFVS